MELTVKDATDAKTQTNSMSPRPESNGRRPGRYGGGQKSGNGEKVQLYFCLPEQSWGRLVAIFPPGKPNSEKFFGGKVVVFCGFRARTKLDMFCTQSPLLDFFALIRVPANSMKSGPEPINRMGFVIGFRFNGFRFSLIFLSIRKCPCLRTVASLYKQVV